MENFNNLILLRPVRCTYRYSSDKARGTLTREGGWRYSCASGTGSAALAANVNKTSAPVTRERHLPASTKGFMMSGGAGGLNFVYRRIYGEFYLFSYCILIVTQIKEFLKKPSFAPSSESIGLFRDFRLIFFFAALHNSQAVYVL